MLPRQAVCSARRGCPFLIAFVASPFAMMVVGVLTVVSARGSMSLGGLTRPRSAPDGRFGASWSGRRRRVATRRSCSPVRTRDAAHFRVDRLQRSSGQRRVGGRFDRRYCAAGRADVAFPPRHAITERMAPARRARTISSTMAYESAADETVFVIGPFVVGILARDGAVGAAGRAAALTLLFVGAFALHPSGRHVPAARGRCGTVRTTGAVPRVCSSSWPAPSGSVSSARCHLVDSRIVMPQTGPDCCTG